MKIITQVSLNGDEVLVKQKRKKAIRPNFLMIGNGTMNRHKIKAIDFIRTMTEMTKPELKVISWITNATSYDNMLGEVYIPMKKYTPQEERQFQKGYKLLVKKDIVRRTKRSHYMINPNAVIPNNYEESKLLWDSLIDKDS